jgi:hypothetical protein
MGRYLKIKTISSERIEEGRMSQNIIAGSAGSRGQDVGKTDRSGKRCDSLKCLGALLLVIAFLGAMGVATRAAAKDTAPAAGIPDASYPASMFDDGKARYFKVKSPDGVTIRYFVMKSSDGIIRAALDACTVCWREAKGYTQKDDVMVCNNCGRRFPSVKINVVTGGCNPIALTRNLEGGQVIIRGAHILEGKRYFALGGGK